MERNIDTIIKKVLNESLNPPMKLTQTCLISEDLKYHLENRIPLTENIFRIYSDKYFKLINEVRNLFNVGKKVLLESGDEVWLDAPMYEDEVEELLFEAKHHGKNVKLNSPFRTPGGPKKFAVYVKTPKGTIKKVTFGDPNLRVRNKNKKAAKSFRARHNCDQKKDRTMAGYWSCNVARYAKKLGLKSSRSW
jgi:hypothetical protein